MKRTIFLGGSWLQCEYWAKAWGFAPGEWIGITPSNFYLIQGLCIDAPVFACGNVPFDAGLIEQLEIAGARTFIDAHDLVTADPTNPHEERSALRLMPLEGGE